ncbi:MAG: hypothetical protein IKY61_00290, partial [Thermoguttaceae bacterium]|nr:hypothetical protein [Thermoguttaceae bacterium]
MKLLKLFLGILVSGAASLSFAAEQQARPARTLGDIQASSFRVVASTGSGQFSTGSGWTCGYTKNHAVGATNAHVVNGAKDVTVQYFGDGRPFNVDARVYRVYDDASLGRDFAWLLMDKNTVALYDPPIIPIAPRVRAEIANNRPIASSGCPEAREPMAWRGRCVGEFGTVQTFKPAPRQGQSGSVIAQMNDDGYFEAVAILSYLMQGDATTRDEEYDFDPQIGGALPLANIYDATFGKTRTSTNDDLQVVPVSAQFTMTPAVSRSRGLPEHVAQTLELTRPALIFACSEYYTPCRQAKPFVNELARNHKVYVADATTPNGLKAIRDYNVRQYPTFIFLEIDADGLLVREHGRLVGYDASTRQRVEQFFKTFEPRPTRHPNREKAPGWKRVNYTFSDFSGAQDKPEDLLDAAERGWTPWSKKGGDADDAPTQTPNETGLISNSLDRLVASVEADVKKRLEAAEVEIREKVKAESDAFIK